MWEGEADLTTRWTGRDAITRTAVRRVLERDGPENRRFVRCTCPMKPI
jgi:hypothetical protein